MKRVFIIHGWDGYPEEGWFPWLKKELEKRDFKVFVPSMPDPPNPKIDEWIKFLKKQVKNIDENTYFVGHSIGCQTIMRYLEKISENKKAGAVIFVAGFIHLTLGPKEDYEIAKPWLETPIDYDKVKQHSKTFIEIMSDNDPFVPLEDSKIFKEKLNAKIIIEKNRWHFSGSDNIKKLPVVLSYILEISKDD